MSNKSLLTPKNTLIILSSLVILAATIVALNQVQQTQQLKSGAAGEKERITCQQISSLGSISSLAKTFPRGSTFCVKIPGPLYRLGYIAAVRAYIEAKGTSLIGEPIDTNLVSSNRIKGTFSYGVPYEREYVQFYYYYYVDSTWGRVQVRVTDGTTSSRNLTTAEKGTIETEGNQIAVYLWGAYSHLVTPLTISSDANFVQVSFRVK